MEIVHQCSWAYTPVVERLVPHDEFFCDGNLECALYIKGYVQNSDVDELTNSIKKFSVDEFVCEVKGCRAIFTCPMDYNHHFSMLHKYHCGECLRSFPSNHLLSIHIAEVHDSWFLVQQEKGLAMYRCFVESCGDTFSADEDRKEHLTSKHKYPPDFRFGVNRRKHTRHSKTRTKTAGARQDAHALGPMESGNGHAAEVLLGVVTVNTNCEALVAPGLDQFMDIDGQVSYVPYCSQHKGLQKPKQKPVLPKSICFGRGAPRGLSKPKIKP